MSIVDARVRAWIGSRDLSHALRFEPEAELGEAVPWLPAVDGAPAPPEASRSASRSAVVLNPGNRNISKMRSLGVAKPYCCRSPYLCVEPVHRYVPCSQRQLKETASLNSAVRRTSRHSNHTPRGAVDDRTSTASRSRSATEPHRVQGVIRSGLGRSTDRILVFAHAAFVPFSLGQLLQLAAQAREGIQIPMDGYRSRGRCGIRVDRKGAEPAKGKRRRIDRIR